MSTTLRYALAALTYSANKYLLLRTVSWRDALESDVANARAALAQSDAQPTLSPSEAVYGFAGWLTCRDEPVIFGSRHNAAIAAELVDAFCKSQNLEPPREQWADSLQPYPSLAASPQESPAPVNPTWTRDQIVAAAESLGMRFTTQPACLSTAAGLVKPPQEAQPEPSAEMAEVAALVAEREAALAWNGPIKGEIDRLTAELDALRADAERYRWMRSHRSNGEWFRLAHYMDDALDQIIDAARAQGGTP
jgi:hypothetical protein